MYVFSRYKKEISEKAPINKCDGSVRMKVVLASLGLVLLMVIGAGLTFSVQTNGLIINVEDVPYDPGTRWIYSVGGKGAGAQSRRLTVQMEKSNAGRSDLLESVFFLEGSGIKRLYVRVLPNAVATYSSPEESTLIHKIQFPLKLGVEMEFQPSGLDSEIGPGPAKVRVTAQEKISVPFGTFNCLKLEVEPRRAKHIREFSQWIAPNVGMVKQKIITAQGTQIFELVDFRRNAEDIWTSISPLTFQTDFHASNLDEWIAASGPWTVADGILSSGGRGKEYIWLKHYVWQDCKISYRFRLISGGDAWISFRANFIDEPRGFSYFQIDDGSVKIRCTNPEGFQTISSYASAPESNQWHRVECVIKDARVDCFIDGKLTVSTQESPVNFGMIGFRTFDTKIEIDDLRVEKLAYDAPKSVHSARSEPKKTLSLVITAAQIPMQVGSIRSLLGGEFWTPACRLLLCF